MGANTVELPGVLRSCLDHSFERGVTPLVVYRDKTPVGLLNVSDQLRPRNGEVIREFGRLGIEQTAILSGDHVQAAKRVARAAGIQAVHARLGPQDKVEVIKQYQADGMPLMFVGDGIYDAPALASSQVGVAMGGRGHGCSPGDRGYCAYQR